MLIMKAIVYLGFERNTEIHIEVNEYDSEIGFTYVNCFECNGTGVWNFVDYIPVDKCINCKGTGKLLINI